MPHYRLYIDEAGNSDLDSSDDQNHRYLCLTGIIIELDYVQNTIYQQLEEFKNKYFSSHPDEPIVLHRKDIVHQKGVFGVLRNEQIKMSFENELLQLFEMWEYKIISVCIDKKKHRDTYLVWRYDPYHYCLQMLLERYVLFLKQKGKNGDVLAESRGGKDDMRLKDSYSRLFKNGTDYVSSELISQYITSKELKVKPKITNISGLQIADLIVHESRKEILKEQNVPSTKELTLFQTKMVSIMSKKYCQRNDGTIYGIGKKFI